MTTVQKLAAGGVALALLFFCCFGILLGITLTNLQAARGEVNTLSAPSPENPAVTPIVVSGTLAPELPPTLVPSLPPPLLPTTGAASENPSAEFLALSEYSQSIRPLLDEGLAVAERDRQILELVEDDPESLCSTSTLPHRTLVADAVAMESLAINLEQVVPPLEVAGPVHDPLLDSASLWSEALQNINRSCQVENQVQRDLLRLGAAIQMGGAIVNFRVANDNFWYLVIANGLEAIIGPRP
jgi:hypothetical protein